MLFAAGKTICWPWSMHPCKNFFPYMLLLPEWQAVNSLLIITSYKCLCCRWGLFLTHLLTFYFALFNKIAFSFMLDKNCLKICFSPPPHPLCWISLAMSIFRAQMDDAEVFSHPLNLNNLYPLGLARRNTKQLNHGDSFLHGNTEVLGEKKIKMQRQSQWITIRLSVLTMNSLVYPYPPTPTRQFTGRQKSIAFVYVALLIGNVVPEKCMTCSAENAVG